MNKVINFSLDGNLDECERQLREEDLSVAEDLVVASWDYEFAFDEKRACTILEALHSRCGEMRQLRRVYHSAASKAVLDAAASIALDCVSVKEFEFTLRSIALTEKAVQACCALPVKKVGIYFGCFSREVEPLYKGLCCRVAPLREFRIHLAAFDTHAMTLLANALPGMRLETLNLVLLLTSVSCVQEDYRTLFKALAQCLDMKDVTLSMNVQDAVSYMPIRLDKPIFSPMLEAIQCMTSLRTLRFGPVRLDTDQWFTLGRTVAKCPHMTALAVNDAQEQVQVDAFLNGCGPHPRLLRVDVGNRFNMAAPVRRWHSWRAQCLTVLLAGSSIQRVGKQSSVYKIPTGIFRKLNSFLLEMSGRIRY